MDIKSILLATTVLTLSGTVNAGTLFAINNLTDRLTAIDTNTLNIMDIGALGTNVQFGGAAYNPFTETLYVIGGSDNNNLFTIDTKSGASTLVGSHGVDDLFGLTYDSSTNALYGVQDNHYDVGSNGFYSLDQSTGSASFIATLALELGGMGGLAYNSAIDELVGIRDGFGDLYTIDRTTGALGLLSDAEGNNSSGLTYDSNLNLYWNLDYSGNLYSYDADTLTRTAHLRGIGGYDGLAYATTTTTVVPVPAALWLFGSGLLGLAGFARRKAS